MDKLLKATILLSASFLAACESPIYRDKDVYIEVYNNCMSERYSNSDGKELDGSNSSCNYIAGEVSKMPTPLRVAVYLDEKDGLKYCKIETIDSGWSICPNEAISE